MKKNYIIIVIIIVIFLGILLTSFINKKENENTNSIEKNLDIEKDNSLTEKIEEYSTLTEFDYESQIQKNGYINKDDALKIAAIKDKNNIEEHGVSEVIAEIKTDENNEKYWFIEIRYLGHSEGVMHHYNRYKINYYTGEASSHGLQVDVDGPSNFKTSI